MWKLVAQGRALTPLPSFQLLLYTKGVYDSRRGARGCELYGDCIQRWMMSRCARQLLSLRPMLGLESASRRCGYVNANTHRWLSG